MTKDFFRFKRFTVKHGGTGLKVTTDACLLGALAYRQNARRILDIGTGNGILALMAAQLHPEAVVTAVEIHPETAELANQNFADSPFSDRIRLICSDIVLADTGRDFDLIVCNPPYFKKHLKGPDNSRNLAMHDFNLSENDLMTVFEDKLSETGKACIIVPPQSVSSFSLAARACGLHTTVITEVFNRPGKHFRTCLQFEKKPAGHKTYQLLLTDENNQRTETFAKLMYDFYL